MTTQQNRTSIKKLISIASVASASVFLSLPAIAQTSTYNGCGSYRGNATTGGGWYCAMDRVNPMYPNRDEASTQQRQSSSDANSSGTGVTSNNGTNTTESQSTDTDSSAIERQSTTTTSQSTTTEQRSTTTSYPATPVTPSSEAIPMDQPQQSTTTNTTTVNQSTDQGVRALW